MHWSIEGENTYWGQLKNVVQAYYDAGGEAPDLSPKYGDVPSDIDPEDECYHLYITEVMFMAIASKDRELNKMLFNLAKDIQDEGDVKYKHGYSTFDVLREGEEFINEALVSVHAHWLNNNQRHRDFPLYDTTADMNANYGENLDV